MLTRKIDNALDLIARCRTEIPLLMECFRAGTPERAALRSYAALFVGPTKRCSHPT